MSIAHLFDSTVRIWRLTQAEDDMRERVKTYVPQTAPTRRNASITPPRGSVTKTEAGNKPVVSLLVSMAASADVQRFDVLEVTGGPEEGRLLRALDVARPRSHHTEVTVENFDGELPEE